MKRKLLITLGILTSLTFTACGSDSKSKSTGPSTNDVKARDYMIMGHNTAVSECNTDFIKQNIQGAFFGNLFEFPSDIDKNSVIVTLGKGRIPCSDYGRVDDLAGNCAEVDLEEQTGKTCVVGLNLVK